MAKSTIYVETSVWNAAFADDASQQRAYTLALLEANRGGRFDLSISDIVLEEIEEAGASKRQQLEELIAVHAPEVLEYSPAAAALADRFNAVALLAGYAKPLRIVSLAEVLYDDGP